MPIKGVTPKCYILSLFVRDDGERFVLGSGYYEFKDKQMHFKANNVANDVIEVQGNDGYLLAGQVRRPGAQEFDGFVGDGTVSKAEVEQKRRAFLAFFRKNHFYKVVYVFSDGTAIQRKRGFLVDDPTVKELYQIYPEYHVALNFEDVNYYSYAEDEDGEEIYSKIAEIQLTQSVATGGLVWDEYGVVWDERQWGGTPASAGGSTSFVVNNQAGKGAPLASVQLNGDTSQQTYSGIQLCPNTEFNTFDGWSFNNTGSQSHFTAAGDNTITFSVTAGDNGFWRIYRQLPTISTHKYYVCIDWQQQAAAGDKSLFLTNNLGANYPYPAVAAGAPPVNRKVSGILQPQSDNAYIGIQIQSYKNSDISATLKNLMCVDLTAKYGAGNEPTKDWCDSNLSWEPYTNGPAPNPDYPQDINVVTGEQTVTVSDGVNSQDYTVNLTSKNLLQNNATTQNISGVNFTVNPDGTITVDGTASAQIVYNINTNVNLTGVYTLSGCPSGGSDTTYKLQLYGTGGVDDMGSGNITTNPNGTVRIVIRNGVQVDNLVFKPMLESGNQPTSYEPYYNYELAKIGTYQDYIYKSGDDWYVHKDMGKVTLDGTQNIAIANWKATTTSVGWIYSYNVTQNVPVQSNTEIPAVLSDKLMVRTYAQLHDSLVDNGIAVYSNTTLGVVIKTDDTSLTTTTAINNYLNSNPITVYYALATSTDTKITDATLIGELEAVEATKLYAGENNFLVTASGTNLPAPLDITYYAEVIYPGGAEWSEGAPMGPTTVEVDSIDTVFPVWTVTGPAINPQLSVLTTNTTFKYNGTVSSSQTLVVDMMNKTVLLNGVNMIGNMEGDWASFSPGTNRVVYTTENTDAVASVIEWQEIVG